MKMVLETKTNTALYKHADSSELLLCEPKSHKSVSPHWIIGVLNSCITGKGHFSCEPKQNRKAISTAGIAGNQHVSGSPSRDRLWGHGGVTAECIFRCMGYGVRSMGYGVWGRHTFSLVTQVPPNCERYLLSGPGLRSEPQPLGKLYKHWRLLSHRSTLRVFLSHKL